MIDEGKQAQGNNSKPDDRLERILDHVRGYHLALDMREHNAGAAFRALLGIQEVLGVEYVQGVEEARQRTGK